MVTLSEREAQARALQVKEDAENPLTIALENPNRFQTVTFFFADDDGIKIETDLDLNDVTVYYLTQCGARQYVITEGALYEWAINAEANSW
jgi:hypothetical protein